MGLGITLLQSDTINEQVIKLKTRKLRNVKFYLQRHEMMAVSEVKMR